MYSYFRTYVLFLICSRYPTPRTYIARKKAAPPFSLYRKSETPP